MKPVALQQIVPDEREALSLREQGPKQLDACRALGHIGTQVDLAMNQLCEHLGIERVLASPIGFAPAPAKQEKAAQLASCRAVDAATKLVVNSDQLPPSLARRVQRILRTVVDARAAHKVGDLTERPFT